MDGGTRDASRLELRAREDIEGAEDKASRRRTPSEVVHVDSNAPHPRASSGVGSGVAKKGAPPFRPTDAPKSNNSTHQSAWDWPVVASTRVVETRSAILAVPPTVQSPAPPVGKSVLAAPRCPPRHRSREPWYEETNAILNLQPQYQEIAKYTRGHCSSSLPFHLARAFDLKSPAL